MKWIIRGSKVDHYNTYCAKKMCKKTIALCDTEIKKRKFHHGKNLILLQDLDIDYLVWFLKVTFKYCIGYKDVLYRNKTLRVLLRKTSAYVKSYNGETKLMYFWLKMINCLKNIFRIMSVIASKKNLIANKSQIITKNLKKISRRWDYRFSW